MGPPVCVERSLGHAHINVPGTLSGLKAFRANSWTRPPRNLRCPQGSATELDLSPVVDGGWGEEPMCDETWEKELAKRWKLLASEDEMKWLPVLEDDRITERIEPVLLPPAPIVEEKKRSPRALTR